MAESEVGIRLRLLAARRFQADAKDSAGALSGIGRAADRAGRQTASAGQRTERYRRGMVAVGRAAALGALAIGGGLVVGIKKSVDAYAEAEVVAAKTQAVIKATGGVANVSAKGVEGLATSLSRQTGVSDEAIASSQNMLLTFKRIRDEKGPENTFKRATKAALDMSVATGTDLQSASVQLGKALQDPVKGAAALSRTGAITKVELEQLRNMAESGSSVFEQQGFILKSLEGQYGGTAKRAGNTFAGAMNKAREAIGNVGEIIGAKLTPYLKSAGERVARFAEQMADGTGAGGRFMRILGGVGRGLLAAGGAVATVAGFVRRHWPEIRAVTLQVFGAVERAVRGAMAYVRSDVVPTIRAIVAGARQFWARFGDDITKVFNFARRFIGRALDTIRAVITGVLAVLRGDWSTAWKSLKVVVRNVFGQLVDFLRTIPAVAVSIAVKIGASVVRGIGRGLAGLASGVRSRIVGALRNLGDLPGFLAQRGAELAKALIRGVVRYIREELPGAIGGAIQGAAAGVGGGIGGFLRDAVSVVDPRPVFAAGGVVPGRPSEPVPIMAHGREVVLTRGQQARVGRERIAAALRGQAALTPLTLPASSGTGAGEEHIHLYIDGREAATAIVRSGGDILTRGVNRHVRREVALR